MGARAGSGNMGGGGFYLHVHIDSPCSVVASTEAVKGVFVSAPWKRGIRGGNAEGEKFSVNAIFVRRPPVASHAPLS